MKTVNKEIVEGIIEYGNHSGDYSLIKELFELVEREKGCDFLVEFDGAEYRVIDNDDIWPIYVEGIKEITQDCYLTEGELPSFIAVDWEETAENCMVDGYGHHFSSYDGGHSETDSFHIFRTN
jgi:hypothetical protein